MSTSKAPFNPPLREGDERLACTSVSPPGFHLRPPPPAHDRTSFLTPDSKLFETIHMGPANVDTAQWRLQVDGLVECPFSMDYEGLRSLPNTTLTAFHECWGSPLRPHTENLLRVGNVQWTGVRLKTLLDHAKPKQDGLYVWSEGLDAGEFGGRQMACYQKDLPIAKAMSEEVLVAYALNGEPLRKERGGPVRLVVPGWFGTNMTKWLCHLAVRSERAPSPFTTIWYNEEVSVNGESSRRPVWEATANSMIVAPEQGSTCKGLLEVRGWAWAAAPIAFVDISIDNGRTWRPASLSNRTEFEWQAFHCEIDTATLAGSQVTILSRATDALGNRQPATLARNASHAVTVHQSQLPWDLARGY